MPVGSLPLSRGRSEQVGPPMQPPSDPIETAVVETEAKIRAALVRLEEQTGKRVDFVEVDTRNFANLRTEIHLK